MGKNKQDTKSTDKGPGGKGGKGKGKGDDEKDTKSSKGAQSINVRHILVSTPDYLILHICIRYMFIAIAHGLTWPIV
jgi:hypothetical protein